MNTTKHFKVQYTFKARSVKGLKQDVHVLACCHEEAMLLITEYIDKGSMYKIHCRG